MGQTLEMIYDIYLKNISNVIGINPKNLLWYNPHKGFSKTCYFPTDEEKQFETIFPKLIAEEDFAALQNLIARMQKSIDKFPSSIKSYKTYCNHFLRFLSAVITDKKYSKILSEIKQAYCIDGIEALIDAIGGEKIFIQKAIENSYFFEAPLVAQRFSEIEKLYDNGDPIPARWQNDRKSGIRPQCSYNSCDIDVNGNAKVRSVITRLTGYSISAGDSTFLNYKISHIWGNAQNPRYFTNLWNIVFVPAWANDLLDKPNAPSGSVSSRLLNTYKQLCIEFYKMKSLSWTKIGMSMPAVDPKDVIKGTYHFNVIGSKIGKAPGHISVVKITLK